MEREEGREDGKRKHIEMSVRYASRKHACHIKGSSVQFRSTELCK